MTATMVLQPSHLSSITEGQQHLQQVNFAALRQQRSNPAPGFVDVPAIVVASEQKALKGEDVVFVKQVEPQPGMCHNLFMVCDGHQGVDAAAFTAQQLPQMLGARLPGHLPDWQDAKAVGEYAEVLRSVLSRSIVELENQWVTRGCTAGTTCTLALVSGWLVTLANTGDSNAIIDDGVVVAEITKSHRIQANAEEQDRLRKGGAQLAPLGYHLQGPAKPREMGVGPIRLWPGGLCVSRSIGDSDSGPLVVPLPHVRQLLVPRTGGFRLLLASDGLWDLMTFEKAAKSIRHKLPHQAVASLLQVVVKDKRMSDDVSIIVLDLLASATTQFPAAALQQAAAAASGPPAAAVAAVTARPAGDLPAPAPVVVPTPAPAPPAPAPKPAKSGGLFSCFKSPAVLEHGDGAAASGPSVSSGRSMNGGSRGGSRSGWRVGSSKVALQPVWKYLADVDCLVEYPHHLGSLAKASMPLSAAAAANATHAGDYTVHGGSRGLQLFNNDAAWYGDRTVHGGSTHSGTAAGDSSHSSPGPSVHAHGLYEGLVSGSPQTHQASGPIAVTGGRRDPMYGHMQGSAGTGGGEEASLYANNGSAGRGPSAAEVVQSRLGGSQLAMSGGETSSGSFQSCGSPSATAGMVYSSSAHFDRDDCVLNQHGDLTGCSSAPPLQGSLAASAAAPASLADSEMLSVDEEEEGSARMPSALTPA